MWCGRAAEVDVPAICSDGCGGVSGSGGSSGGGSGGGGGGGGALAAAASAAQTSARMRTHGVHAHRPC
eukprot:433625-Pelagomonas_calceolata.AAC.1